MSVRKMARRILLLILAMPYVVAQSIYSFLIIERLLCGHWRMYGQDVASISYLIALILIFIFGILAQIMTILFLIFDTKSDFRKTDAIVVFLFGILFPLAFYTSAAILKKTLSSVQWLQVSYVTYWVIIGILVFYINMSWNYPLLRKETRRRVK